MRRDDKIDLIGPANGVQPKRVHVRLDAGIGIGASHFAELVAPPRIGCGVDAADRALSVRLDQGAKTADLVRQ